MRTGDIRECQSGHHFWVDPTSDDDRCQCLRATWGYARAVPIPLPPEPPRDRVIEALDADGRVCKRFTKVQKYWVCELGAGWLWRELLSTSIKQSWSLRHLAAESGEQL